MQSRMCLFFIKLPTDLHRHVLHTWLTDSTDPRSTLKLLSAFDVACCTRALRGQLLELLSSHPASMWPDSEGLQPFGCKDITAYWNWLATRRIGMKFIALTDGALRDLEHALDVATLRSLPFIETVACSSTVVLPQLLAACPNLTSLENYYGQNAVWLDRAVEQSSKLAKLSLSFGFHECTGSIIADAVVTMGSRLKALKVDYDSILTDVVLTSIAQCCENLETLSIGAFELPTELLVNLIHSCTHLQDVMFYDYDGELNGITAMLEASHPALRKFGISCCGGISTFANFVVSLTMYTSLDYLRIGEWSYCRSTCELLLAVNGLGVNALESFCYSCPPICRLQISGGLYEEDDRITLQWIADHLVVHLEQLTLNNSSLTTLLFLSKPCPLLTSIVMKEDITDQHLRQIAQFCPRLKQFALDANTMSPITDNGMMALFEGCRELTEVSLRHAPFLTSLFLQAMLRCEVKVVKFCCERVGFSEQDARQFCRWAREKQVLPVPVFEFTN